MYAVIGEQCMSVFQSERSIPLPVEEILPCVTLPIIANYYSDAGAIVDNLRQVVFKGHFNQSTLTQVERGLFVASFGRAGEHDLSWENEKYIDEIKANQAKQSSEGVTACTK